MGGSKGKGLHDCKGVFRYLIYMIIGISGILGKGGLPIQPGLVYQDIIFVERGLLL